MVNAKSKIVDGSIITVILDVTIVCVKQVLSYLLDILQGYVVYDEIPDNRSNYGIKQCVTFRPTMLCV